MMFSKCQKFVFLATFLFNIGHKNVDSAPTIFRQAASSMMDMSYMFAPDLMSTMNMMRQSMDLRMMNILSLNDRIFRRRRCKRRKRRKPQRVKPSSKYSQPSLPRTKPPKSSYSHPNASIMKPPKNSYSQPSTVRTKPPTSSYSQIQTSRRRFFNSNSRCRRYNRK